MVENTAQAAALVIASDPRFAGVTPLQRDVDGQSAWYEAYPSDSTTHGTFEVSVTIGWGRCLTACRYRHTWHHVVEPDGPVGLVRETGDDLPPLPRPNVTGAGSLDILLLASPTCGMDTDPPGHGCPPRPVSNATVVIRDLRGNEVARMVSDAEGHIPADRLPPAIYMVEARPVEGYLAAPPAAAVWVRGSEPITATLVYDTGIR